MPVTFSKSGPASVGKWSSIALKALILPCLGLIFVLGTSNSAHAQKANSKIWATYKIGYNGLHLGKLHFSSTLQGRSYKMESNAKLSVPLLGSIFKSLSWRGVTSASGTVQGKKPRPNRFYFAFRSGKKTGKIDMRFAGNSVARVVRVPNKKLSAVHIPVTKAHLRRVMDPMSALMLLTRKGKSHRTACSQTIPIYDGVQRFNLKLSYKRAIRVNRSQSGGYSGPVIICRVRYQPISGHKPHKKEIKYMVNNRKMEIWLMPLPKSRNYAPYRFVVPLPVGTADAYLSRFNIKNGSGRQIALVR